MRLSTLSNSMQPKMSLIPVCNCSVCIIVLAALILLALLSMYITCTYTSLHLLPVLCLFSVLLKNNAMFTYNNVIVINLFL